MGRRQLLPVLQKATQALTSSWSVSIAQYNILGGYLAKPKYFPYCQPHLLEWDNRKERIFSEITEHQVCCANFCQNCLSCYMGARILLIHACIRICVRVGNASKRECILSHTSDVSGIVFLWYILNVVMVGSGCEIEH